MFFLKLHVGSQTHTIHQTKKQTNKKKHLVSIFSLHKILLADSDTHADSQEPLGGGGGGGGPTMFFNESFPIAPPTYPPISYAGSIPEIGILVTYYLMEYSSIGNIYHSCGMKVNSTCFIGFNQNDVWKNKFMYEYTKKMSGMP